MVLCLFVFTKSVIRDCRPHKYWGEIRKCTTSRLRRAQWLGPICMFFHICFPNICVRSGVTQIDNYISRSREVKMFSLKSHVLQTIFVGQKKQNRLKLNLDLISGGSPLLDFWSALTRMLSHLVRIWSDIEFPSALYCSEECFMHL